MCLLSSAGVLFLLIVLILCVVFCRHSPLKHEQFGDAPKLKNEHFQDATKAKTRGNPRSHFDLQQLGRVVAASPPCAPGFFGAVLLSGYGCCFLLLGGSLLALHSFGVVLFSPSPFDWHCSFPLHHCLSGGAFSPLPFGWWCFHPPFLLDGSAFTASLYCVVLPSPLHPLEWCVSLLPKTCIFDFNSMP